MGKRKIQVEWIVTEDDDAWQHAQQTPLTEQAQVVVPTALKHPSRMWLVWIVTLMLIGVGATWLGRSSQAGLHQIEREVSEAVQVEVGALAARSVPSGTAGKLQQGGDALRMAVQANTLEDAPQIESELVAIQGNKAAALVLIPAKSGGVLRQVRFYLRREVSWQPMTPDESLWGAPRQFESTYFIFHFHQRDAAAVAGMTAQVDEIYATLLDHFGLPQPDTKRVIKISMLRDPAFNHQPLESDAVWIVASPARYLAPLEVSDSDLLAQSIALALLDDTLAQAQAQYGVKWQWLPVYSGLELWQLWEMDLPLSVWHDDLVTWYFGYLPSAEDVLPERYDELCAAHALWMFSPMDIHIPYLCTNTEQRNAWCCPRTMLTDLRRLELLCGDLCSWSREVETSSWPYCSGESVALSTVVEYAVDAYGYEHLPALLVGMGRDETWDILVPAVFGVSPTQFEQGWQRYITTHYK